MGDTELTLWLDSLRYDALERALNMHGLSMEKVMQEQLIALYADAVPEKTRQEIDSQIERGRLEVEEWQRKNRIVSVFLITEQGAVFHVECAHPFEFLQAARQTRRYLRGELDGLPATLAAYFLRTGHEISTVDFESSVPRRMENDGHISGVFDIDLDSGIFSAVNVMDGWGSFSLKDVTAAVYHAYRKDVLSIEKRWDIFLERLDGKRLTCEKTAMDEGEPISSFAYVSILPEATQTAIREDIIAALTAEGSATEENICLAMDSRLCDLEDLLDTRKYLTTEEPEGMIRIDGQSI